MQIVMAMQDHPDRSPMLSFTVSNQEAERIKRWRKAKPDLDLIVEIAVLVCEGDEARRQNRTVAEDLLWSTSRYCSSRGCGCDNRHARAPAAGNPLGTESIPVLVHQSKEDQIGRASCRERV